MIVARRQLWVGAVVLLTVVVAAGCGGTQGSAPPTPTDTAITTTDPGTRTTAGTLPPGVTDDNVTDSVALIASHVETLSTQSFTVVSTVRIRDLQSNQTLRRSRSIWRMVPTGTVRGEFFETTTRVVDDSGEGSSGQRRAEIASYRRGDTVLRRTVTQEARSAGPGTQSVNESRVEFSRPTLTNASVRLGPAFNRDPILAVSEATNVTVNVVRRGGTRRYQVTARLPDGPIRSNRTVGLLVRPDGLVTRIEKRYVSSYSEAVFSQTIRFRAIGETTVERPDWYSTAQNATDD